MELSSTKQERKRSDIDQHHQPFPEVKVARARSGDTCCICTQVPIYLPRYLPSAYPSRYLCSLTACCLKASVPTYQVRRFQ